MTMGGIIQKAFNKGRSLVRSKAARLAVLGWLSGSSPKWRQALAYLVAITLAETLTMLVEPRAGLVAYGLVLLALVLQAALDPNPAARGFLLTLTLAPLTRLLSLVLPLKSFPLVYWYMVVGAPLFMAAIFAARAGNLSRAMLGFKLGKLPFQALVSLIGIGLGLTEYLILRPEPLVPEFTLAMIWKPALILLVFTGLLEEFIFRGLLQQTGLANLGKGGLVYSALVFAVLHMGYRSWLDLVFVFAVALLFGWIVKHGGSLLGVTIAHGLTNIGLFLVFPFLLAAPAIPKTAPITVEQTAPVVSTRIPVVEERAAPVLLAPLQAVPTPPPDRPQPALSKPLVTPKTPKPTPSSTPSPKAVLCGPPAGWVQYKVRFGDWLAKLSRRFGVSVEELRLANCMETDALKVGQLLWVPSLIVAPTSVPTDTPWPIRPPATTQPPLIVITPTKTGILPAPSATVRPPTPTPTSTPTPTNTLSPTVTQTLVPPTATDTPAPTDTPTPKFTLKPTNTPRPTDTLTPGLPTLTDTPLPTNPPRPTNTPRPSFTPKPTNTPKPTATLTPEPPTPTDTLTPGP